MNRSCDTRCPDVGTLFLLSTFRFHLGARQQALNVFCPPNFYFTRSIVANWFVEAHVVALDASEAAEAPARERAVTCGR